MKADQDVTRSPMRRAPTNQSSGLEEAQTGRQKGGAGKPYAGRDIKFLFDASDHVQRQLLLRCRN